ncbi:hypothetical protein B0H17DRAFT_1075421 [Mycena rosella]|uniref:Uncharacterized protein n=1 Tax=Mycena rosella TaxID=1033263 RepID=A0AAD7GDY7_MYCRO|nr:hypothetical protein B0H17DRAFT_1075421 [Mycena rosella]
MRTACRRHSSTSRSSSPTSSSPQEGRYVSPPPSWHYAELSGPHKGKSPFPKGVRLKHIDVPEDEPYKLRPLPSHIVLLPQSYFALDVRSTERFQSLVPYLDASNAQIRVPKFHTFLEGIVAFVVDPPTGRAVPYRMDRFNMLMMLESLLLFRCKYPPDEIQPDTMLPVEREILDELTTEHARWWMRVRFTERRRVSPDDLAEYRRQNPTDVHRSSPYNSPLYPRTSSTLPRANTTSPTLPRARSFSSVTFVHGLGSRSILAASRRLARFL